MKRLANCNIAAGIVMCALGIYLLLWPGGHFRYHCAVTIVTNADWIITSGFDRANRCHAEWWKYIGTNVSTEWQVNCFWRRIDE